MNDTNKYGIKYTDEHYSTLQEFKNSMGSSLVSIFWKDVLKYRNEYRINLPFKNIIGENFYFTFNDTINGKFILADKKIEAITHKIDQSISENLKKQILRFLLGFCLNSIKKNLSPKISVSSLNALVLGTYAEANPEHYLIKKYKDLLVNYSLENNNFSLEEYVAYSYQTLLGQEELTQYYRSYDFIDERPLQSVTGSTEYNYAPSDKIDGLMDEYFANIDKFNINTLTYTNIPLPIFVKQAITYFYFNYVKPFDKYYCNDGNLDSYNIALGILLSKKIAFKKSKYSFFLPLECLTSDLNLTKYISEVKKTGDLSYFIMNALDTYLHVLNNLESEIDTMQIKYHKDEFVLNDEDENKESSKEENDSSKVTANFTESVPTDNESNVIKNEKVEEKPENNIKVESINKAKTNLIFDDRQLSDKEIKEYIIYLMETNPNLNKNQATFYANHSHKGRFYTIQQFKKEMHVVYETARTSMDKLASLGYYEKKQIKNKFVYTPTDFLGE